MSTFKDEGAYEPVSAAAAAAVAREWRISSGPLCLGMCPAPALQGGGPSAPGSCEGGCLSAGCPVGWRLRCWRRAGRACGAAWVGSETTVDALAQRGSSLATDPCGQYHSLPPLYTTLESTSVQYRAVTVLYSTVLF